MPFDIVEPGHQRHKLREAHHGPILLFNLVHPIAVNIEFGRRIAGHLGLRKRIVRHKPYRDIARGQFHERSVAGDQQRRWVTGTRIAQGLVGAIKYPIPHGEKFVVVFFHREGRVQRTKDLGGRAEVDAGEPFGAQRIKRGNRKQRSPHPMSTDIE